jgi:hypothetical protein
MERVVQSWPRLRRQHIRNSAFFRVLCVFCIPGKIFPFCRHRNPNSPAAEHRKPFVSRLFRMNAENGMAFA